MVQLEFILSGLADSILEFLTSFGDIQKVRYTYVLFFFIILTSAWLIIDKKYRVFFDNLHQELTCYRLVFGLLRFFKHLCDPKTFKGSLQKKKCWFWDIVSISFPLPPLGPIETFLIETFLVLFNPSPRKPLEHFCSQGWKPYITFLYLGLEAPGTSL